MIGARRTLTYAFKCGFQMNTKQIAPLIFTSDDDLGNLIFMQSIE